jgi:hypothetical protein
MPSVPMTRMLFALRSANRMRPSGRTATPLGLASGDESAGFPSGATALTPVPAIERISRLEICSRQILSL